MVLQALARRPADNQVYLLLALVSLCLSTWSTYAQYIPNPDAGYYLRSAELFAQGRWHDGLVVYRWPFYSLNIAAVIAVTGLQAQVAANLVNMLLDCVTVICFVALVRRLGGEGGRSIMLWAGLFILLHPKVMQLRPVIVRDHGFLAFFLLTLYLVARDQAAPKRWIKPAIVGAIGGAALFRLEALFLLLLVPAFYSFTAMGASRRRWVVIAVVVVACLLLVPGFFAWSGWNSLDSVSKASVPDVIQAALDRARIIFAVLRERSEQFGKLMPPFGRNIGGMAYAGVVVSITLDVLLRALTIPIAVLAVLAFTPQRLLNDGTFRFVGWFALWQIPLLLIFMTFTMFLDWRYAMPFALMAGIPAVFTVDAIAKEWSSGILRARYLLPVALAALILGFVLVFPGFSKLNYLREAGYWAKNQVPAGATILTNDNRIAYFSARPYESGVRLRTTDLLADSLKDTDYMLLSLDRGGDPPAFVNGLQSKLVGTFSGQGGQRVLAYKLR
jgi:4-amino-4-deoxy-L-arabinose transferase-like glycosyltransferase